MIHDEQQQTRECSRNLKGKGIGEVGGVAFVRENSKSSKQICIYEEKPKQTKNTRGKNRGLPWPPRGGGKPRNFLEDRIVKVEQGKQEFTESTNRTGDKNNKEKDKAKQPSPSKFQARLR